MAAFVAVLDGDGTLLDVNVAALEASGLQRQDVVGKKFWEGAWWSYDPAVAAQIRGAVERAAAGERVRFDVAARVRDGHRLDIDFMIVPVRDRHGAVAYLVPSGFDVTERNRAMAALRESESRFQTLANNISQFAWMADASGFISWYNERWFDYTGTTLEEMKGWGWTQVHHPDHVDRVVERFTRSIETGEAWEDTFPLRGRDGSYRWFLSRALPVRAEGGDVLRWFGTNTDITQRLDLERALGQLNRSLEARVEERTEQVRLLSRDLTLAEHRERRRIAHVLHDELQQVLFAAQMALGRGRTERGLELVVEATKLTRSLSHELSPPLLDEDEDVGELLRWLATHKRDLYDLDVEVEAGSISIRSVGLRVLLYQLLREVLFNVAKHAGAERASVLAEQEGGRVRITVEDDGVGFDPARRPEGSGLRRVRERVEVVGGRFSVGSTPGVGTRVVLEIPLEAFPNDPLTG